ncbi:uncharacterized protein LOC118749337 [Rhagoletis pomonella]|uniref:uncharacterized protein LOC118749337 n=1 Tax=Rhagoletis pomonella TaxID=28610 RepID=UPI001785EDBF|nr:uncharacterized protein LOC118749337 [Rhagoletis pomonella]
MDPIKKSAKRRSFLKSLTKQLAISNIEDRATNVRITCYANIRNAMEALDVKVISRPAPGTAPEYAPRSNRPSCHLCRAQYKRQRKTWSYCYSCNKVVCAGHSTTLHRCHSCTPG